MSTMGMYRVRWPAMRFGPKYEKKRPKIAKDFKKSCEGHWIAVMACVRKTSLEDRGLCDKYMHEMFDCVETARQRKKEVSSAKYRLSKFMRGRESFGIMIIKQARQVESSFSSFQERMTNNVKKPDSAWVGKATTAFKVFNWELFVKPRKWIMITGFVIMLGCTGKILFELSGDQSEQKRIQHNKRVLQLAEEIKKKDAEKKQQDDSEL